MTNEELDSTKSFSKAVAKTMDEMNKKMSKSVLAVPILEPRVDPTIEMLANIEDNTKYQFWKNLAIAVIGGIIGGAVPYLLVFLLG